jgi:hypothetical protein
MRFKALTEVTMKINVFWNMTPSSLVEVYLHFHDKRVKKRDTGFLEMVGVVGALNKRTAERAQAKGSEALKGVVLQDRKKNNYFEQLLLPLSFLLTTFRS